MRKLLFTLLAVTLLSCTTDDVEISEEVQKLRDSVDNYLSDYNNKYQDLYYETAKAHWQLNTKIVEGDTTAEHQVKVSEKEMANYTGSKENIELTERYLSKKDDLLPLQIKQLEAIRYAAASNPEVVSDIVEEKIAADAKQVKLLYGYDFNMDGKSVSTNYIDSILSNSNDPEVMKKAWEVSKQVGPTLKDGVENLRNLRNSTVAAVDYLNYFDYQVSDYGMTTIQMRELTNKIINDIWPLYRELHTWTRYELAERYGKEVPEYIPAHWLPNRWGQEWSSLVDVEGIDLDKELSNYDAQWIVKTGEDFYASLGMERLPESFYEKSSLYPLPPEAEYKKNNHASAWHLNLADDVRSLMSVEPNTKWWGTTLHELGHIYYYISYSNPEVPIVLRGGANRAFHEGFGSMIGLAAMQKPFLEGRGLLPENTKVDKIKMLLKEALDQVVVIPWGAGVMTEFEYSLYAEDLPKDNFNSKWWELKKKYQGIVPPMQRGEEYCDPCTKTHINNDPAQYYDYALSVVLLFQFHNHIATEILNQDPRETNYWGNKKVGDFLRELMAPGATEDWRDLMNDTIGEDISAKAMINYFQPLMEWLKEQNKGREHTLPEKVEL